MEAQNPRRPHLTWVDPSHPTLEVQGGVKEVLLAVAERAPTPEMRDALRKMAEESGQGGLLPTPIPIIAETRPLPDGVSQKGAEFICEPCGVRLKGYAAVSNHGAEEAHRDKVEAFTKPTSIEAPPREPGNTQE